MAERRNDIGVKVMVSVISLLLGIILTVSIFTARDAQCYAQANAIEIKGITSWAISVKEDLTEIKQDVKILLRGNAQ